MLVLKSSDWLDIPDTVVEDVEVALPEKVQAIYKEFKKELWILIENKDEIEADWNGGVEDEPKA